MCITGLMPYIRETRGSNCLKIFSSDAVEWHQDSIFDSKTRQIYSHTDMWIHNSPAVDKEWNFTDVPTKKGPLEEKTNDEGNTPELCSDNDSVSTFRSQHTSHRKNGETPDANTINNKSLESIRISTGPELSGLSDNEPRIDKLEKQFERFTTSFASSIS